jgi:predicted DNA-binding protein (MmcQ/YjbR family)
MRRSQGAEETLRKFALSYPESHEDFPWGERVIKVRGKVFVFMGLTDMPLGLSVKLPQSAEAALGLPFASPTRYGLGRSGWVTLRFPPEAKPPLDLLRDWIDESYRAVAPKNVVAKLPAAGRTERFLRRTAVHRTRGRAIVGPLERLRRLCLGMPDTSERLSHGEPIWFVRQKTFVMYADHHHDDRLAFWCAAPAGLQEARVAADPERFFVPPYVGQRGWLGVWLDVPVDWDDIGGLVTLAHRVVASPLSSARPSSKLATQPWPKRTGSMAAAKRSTRS